MQDMGAAGITCSTSEMSAKGEHGMIIWLDKVPLRQENMEPWEILLSESQERMLVIGRKGEEQKLNAIFDKWDLNCVQIGIITKTQRLEYFWNGEKVGDIPAESLVLGGGAPVYQREYKKPAYYEKIGLFNLSAILMPQNLKEVALFLSCHCNLVSRKWVYRQYDAMVGAANMNSNEPSDAAVVRVLVTDKALAASLDCNARYVFADPEIGAEVAVAEAARNVICSGGTPLAITNCLNFGNPYKPENYWQFSKAIEGMGEACRFFNTPVTGGNVSFYNESPDTAVYPTPVIGMVGLIENIDNVVTSYFKDKGDLVYVLGADFEEMGGSEYIKVVHGLVTGNAPRMELQTEKDL